MHAATDIGCVVEWFRSCFKLTEDENGCLAVLHNRNKMVTTFGNSEWVTQANGSVVSRSVTSCAHHSKAPPGSTAVPKEEPDHTEAQPSTVRNPVRNSQGSPDLSTDHGRTLNQKLMTFRALTTLNSTKLCWTCLKHPKRKLVNSEHQTVGFTLQLLGFDFIMYQKEHCMSQTKLKSHMISLDRID